MIVRWGCVSTTFRPDCCGISPRSGFCENFSAPRALKMGQRIGLITVRTHAGVPDGARALCDISFRDCRLDRSRVIALGRHAYPSNQSFQVDAPAAIDSYVNLV